MSSFYGTFGGGNGSSVASNIVFVDTVNDLPEEGEADTLYVTKLDGIFIYNGSTYVNTASASVELEWIDY